MRYFYNDLGKLINGVIFFFEKGDVEIAIKTFELILTSKQVPASIVWEGHSTIPSEILNELRIPKVLDQGYLGVRFTISEDLLLKKYLGFLRKRYPALSSIVDEINIKVFGIKH